MDVPRYAVLGIKDTFDLDDAVRSYYVQMFPLNVRCDDTIRIPS